MKLDTTSETMHVFPPRKRTFLGQHAVIQTDVVEHAVGGQKFTQHHAGAHVDTVSGQRERVTCFTTRFVRAAKSE